MGPKFVAGFIFIFVLTQIIFLTIEGQFVEAEFQTKLETLTTFKPIERRELFGVLPVPFPNTSYFTTVVSAATYDYPLLNSGLGLYFKWIVLVPITGGVVFSLFAFLLSLLSGVLRR